MTVLVTGASGFVGGAVGRRLHADGVPVRPVSRSAASGHSAGWDVAALTLVPSLTADTDWSAAVAGVNVVVHCAARVHVMADTTADPLAAFRAVNVEGTLNLARQAVAAGVRRFVFVSTVKVNGEATVLGCPYSADDTPAPEDPYGISKAEAEAGLRALAQESGMELTVIRPTLVYGPGVKGNFASMWRWVGRGWPLPLAGVGNNRRSLVALDNLVDLIATCIEHPRAAGQVFLVSDGEDVSTAALLQRIARAQGRKARLFAVPPRGIDLTARMLGKREVAQRLLGSLQVDIGKNRVLLGWQPPLSLDEGLRRMVQGSR